MRTAWQILKTALSEFSDDDAMTLAGALAFYTALSLGPLILILIKISALLDPAAQQHLVEQITSLVGTDGARAVQAVIDSGERNQASGTVAAVLGLVTLAFSATGVFAQLQMSLNRIWDVRARPGQSVWNWLAKRLLSVGMILSVAFLLLVSLAVSSVLEALLASEALLWSAANLAISLGVSTLLFAAMFRFLPDVRVRWRDVWVGAGATAVLFAVGKTAIAVYLGRAAVGSAYGAFGSLVVLLLWAYYSAAIFFLGAELTQAFAAVRHSPIAPDEHAEWVPGAVPRH